MKLPNFVRKTPQSFKEHEAMKTFGVAQYDPNDARNPFPFPRRGSYNCNKTDGRGNDCPWHVPFSYKVGKAAYLVTKGLCLQHNHRPPAAGLDGRTRVESIKELTKEEEKAICTLAVSASGMPSIKQSLLVEFLNRDYKTEVLWRKVNERRDQVFGKDRKQINEVCAHGRAVAAQGGVWVPIVSPETLRFDGFHYQTARMRGYAATNGSYFACADGTHNSNMHRFIVVPWVSMCCLGLSCICSLSAMFSENSYDVIESAQHFSIASRSADDECDEVSRHPF